MLKGVVVTLLGALLLAGVPAGSASAQRDLFKTEVVGIQVAGQLIAGISGGAPWDVAAGEAKIKPNGDVKVVVEGLVLQTPIIASDPVFPVLGVCASLVCQKTVAGSPTNEQVATTGNFPLSPVTGNAKIGSTADANITLPAICVAPIVLVRASAIDSGFFAPVCMGGAGTCTATGVPVFIGCNGPWIAASGF